MQIRIYFRDGIIEEMVNDYQKCLFDVMMI